MDRAFGRSTPSLTPRACFEAPHALLFQNIRIIESFELDSRIEVHVMAYLVADRIDANETKHRRHKANTYPHENRITSSF